MGSMADELERVENALTLPGCDQRRAPDCGPCASVESRFTGALSMLRLLRGGLHDRVYFCIGIKTRRFSRRTSILCKISIPPKNDN
ncbi:hypothetical protein BDZ89DRAFT_1069316 [Hymenopellis radicata]|nr:hypothetical protein BDZ89DRAFT_1069316 [Hymenopellis radicata]